MNLLVALDANYIPPLCVMLKSLVETCKTETIDVYVAHSTLTDADLTRIQKLVSSDRLTIFGVRVPDALFHNAPVLKRISKETYYRLFASEYLPKELDRILYIDPDTLILKDISAFYHMDFKDNLYVGCGHLKGFVNWVNTNRLGIPYRYTYVNAGVLMLNLQALREVFSAQSIFDFIQKQGWKLFLSDQDVLNGLYYARMGYADTNLYNLDERCFARYLKKNGEEKGKALLENETCILHYNGKYKPWKPEYKGVLDAYYPGFIKEEN